MRKDRELGKIKKQERQVHEHGKNSLQLKVQSTPGVGSIKRGGGAWRDRCPSQPEPQHATHLEERVSGERLHSYLKKAAGTVISPPKNVIK